MHDEILVVNGIDVEGGDLAQLVAALKSDEEGLSVSMRVRRPMSTLAKFYTMVPSPIVHGQTREVLGPAHLQDIGLLPPEAS